MSEEHDWKTAWQYNVVDKYKGLTVDQIRVELRKEALPFAVCMAQIQGDFNFSTLIRSSNAFGAQEVFYFGKKKFDRRGALGTYHYTDVRYLEDMEKLTRLKDRYTFVAIENAPGAVSLCDFEWPDDPLMIFGEESNGLSEEVLAMCDHVVSIDMRGSVRSINVGCASSIVMYDYSSKFRSINGM